jgi:hypothetical protein
MPILYYTGELAPAGTSVDRHGVIGDRSVDDIHQPDDGDQAQEQAQERARSCPVTVGRLDMPACQRPIMLVMTAITPAIRLRGGDA